LEKVKPFGESETIEFQRLPADTSLLFAFLRALWDRIFGIGSSSGVLPNATAISVAVRGPVGVRSPSRPLSPPDAGRFCAFGEAIQVCCCKVEGRLDDSASGGLNKSKVLERINEPPGDP
jgi:hypothetical protein